MIENRNPARRWTRGLAVCAVLALFAGCQSGGTRPEGASNVVAAPARPEDLLLVRATERWQLLVAGKFAEAYQYLSPGYREVVEFAEYDKQMQGRQMRWTDARATDVECAQQKCHVRIQMSYVVRVSTFGVGEVPISTTLMETWVASGDGWYFLPDRL